MIRIDYHDGVVCDVDVRNRVAVYLDNDAIIELAKGSEDRRARFVDAVRSGGSLLFSMANAAEIGGPKGASAEAVRRFLDALGACWAPLELNPWKVMEKEGRGEWERATISDRFVTSYFQQRAYDQSPGGASVLNLDADCFFRLSAVADWATQPEAVVCEQAAQLDSELVRTIAEARADYETDPASLDRRWPPIAFDERRAGTFALVHLLRLLVSEAKSHRLKKNDGLDLCHAVMASSSAAFASIDKHWKGRVSRLPTPNRLARVFYRPEINTLVTNFEAAVRWSAF